MSTTWLYESAVCDSTNEQRFVIHYLISGYADWDLVTFIRESMYREGLRMRGNVTWVEFPSRKTSAWNTTELQTSGNCVHNCMCAAESVENKCVYTCSEHATTTTMVLKHCMPVAHTCMQGLNVFVHAKKLPNI